MRLRGLFYISKCKGRNLFGVGKTLHSSFYIGWNTEPLKSLNVGAMSWGIGLALHFVFFLFAQKNAIRGYAKEEIFQ